MKASTKKYEKEHAKQQHCATCNRYVKYYEQYANYVCKKCVELATDKAGKSLEFFNITLDGHGCQGKYIETGKLYRSTTCFIKGIKCFADEAYFGGVVIRPVK